MLKIQEFILNNDNWEELLAAEPYYLKIGRKGNLISFNYSMFNSDFNEPIVSEARGLILEDKTFKVVAMAFTKFWNYGESLAANIDWSSELSITEKMDGSIITVYPYQGYWRVKTNGTIDAVDADLEAPPYMNFFELFCAAALNSGFSFDKLDTNYCYVFELISPFNPICCQYSETKLIHLTTRNLITLEEENIDIGVEKPKTYYFSNLEEAIIAANSFNELHEGFVVCDKNHNRIKIKSDEYLRIHRLRDNNGTLTLSRAVDLIMENEEGEFLSYFPHYTPYIEKIKAAFIQLKETIQNDINAARPYINNPDIPRKLFAAYASEDAVYKPVWFLVYDGKVSNANDYIFYLKKNELYKLIEQIANEL